MIFVYAILILSTVGFVLSALLQVAEKLLADYGTVTVRVNDEKELILEGGTTLLDALYSNGIFIPSACGGKGTCGFCKVRVPEGAGPLLPTEKPFLTRGEQKRGTRLACQVKVKTDLVVTVRPEYLKVQQFSAKVSSARMLTHDTREIRMRLEDPAEIAFSPGQYVQVIVPGTGEFRAYSISCEPDAKCEVELIVRLIPGGLGSTYLHDVKEGDAVTFTGPYGEFELSEDPGVDLVLIGGGCGLAPIKSIVRHCYSRWPERRVHLFFGARSKRDVFYLEDFEAFAKEHPSLDLHYALSEPEPEDAWEGETGFIHLSVESCLKRNSKRQAFLCGPPPMVDAATKVLRAKGVRRDAVFYDKF